MSIKHLICARIEQLRDIHRQLQQKLNSDVTVASKVSCSNVLEGAGHHTIAVGDDVKFNSRTAASFHGMRV